MAITGIELRIGNSDPGAGADQAWFADFYSFTLQHPSQSKPDISLSELLKSLRRLKLQPSTIGLDLLALACAAYAADTSVNRYKNSDDGWTRQFHLFVPVSNEASWQAQGELVARILNFLTGDLWQITFRQSDTQITVAQRPMKPTSSTAEMVCLFSGGMDSFLGAMELLENGEKPLLVGHAKSSDVSSFRNQAFAALQQRYTASAPDLVNAYVRVTKPRRGNQTLEGENTERGRSFLFLALGAACASALPTVNAGQNKKLWIPENGFITLNLPLSPLRMGAYSTRTTHPYYLTLVQQLLDALSLDITIENPFEFKTKGEMLADCADPAFAASVNTMSCSRPGTRNSDLEGKGNRHCGRCVPCIIRRAALNRAAIADDNALLPADRKYRTDIYRETLHASTAKATNKAAKGENVMAFRYLLTRVQASPNFLPSAIQLTGPLKTPADSLAVYQRGLAEVEAVLQHVHLVD
jgi:hypothetical protein